MNEPFHSFEQTLKSKLQATRLPHIRLEERVLAQQERKARGRFGLQRTRWLAAGGAFAAVLLLLGMLSTIPAAAEQLKRIPVVGKLFTGDIFSFAGDRGIITGDQIGLSVTLDETATDNGVTIKLQDAMYDGARLAIGYEIHSEQSGHLIFLEDVVVAVNGVVQQGATMSIKPYQISDQRSLGILTINLDIMADKDQFELELVIGQVSGFNQEGAEHMDSMAGQWRFKTTVVNKALPDSRYQRLANGHTAKSKAGEFQVLGYLLTPATTQIDVSFSRQSDWLRFQLTDEQGRIVEWLDSRSDGSTHSTRYAPLPAGTNELHITPYVLLVDKMEDKRVSAALKDTFPIVLSQGKVGEIIVKNVEFKADETLIYYGVEGKNPHTQMASLWLETEAGEPIITGNGDRTRINDSTYDYVMKYPALDPAQGYTVNTMIQTDLKLFEELTIKVDVAQ